jgi:hypothetical protein
MQTRHLTIATLIFVFGLAWAGTAAAGPIKERIHHQRERIQKGIASGALTRREAEQLRYHQRKIRELRHYYLADGHLTRRERQALNRRLDRNSDRIHALKHNRHMRRAHWWWSYRR